LNSIITRGTMREKTIALLMEEFQVEEEIGSSTQSKEVLQARGVKSYEEISAFLASIRGKPDVASQYLKQSDTDGFQYTLDVGASVPSNPEHEGLFITFQKALYASEPQFIPNGTKSAEMLINIGLKQKAEDMMVEEGGWFNFLVNRINMFFKRSYYIYNIYPKFIRLKYYGSKSTNFSIAPLGKDPGTEKQYYNKPSILSHMVDGVGDKVLTRIRFSKHPEETKNELELGDSSGLNFIKNTYKLLVPDEFKKNMTNSSRHKLFSDLYDLYLQARDELMSKTKTVKLNAAQLSEMIRKQVVAALKESEKGTPEWKSIDKHEKTDTSVQPPKEVDGGDTAPKALKDLMGMGGDEVLVSPEDHVPASDKADEKTQLEPSAKKAVSESKKPTVKAKEQAKLAEEDEKWLTENVFFMRDSDDVGFRF
jgi:hypothetical protein